MLSAECLRPLFILALGSAMLGVEPLAGSQQEVPAWAQASLTEEDVGPGFERTRAESVVQPGIASYLVLFERQAAGDPSEPFAIGSLILRVEGDVPPPSFDEIASAIVRARGGLQATDGPELGDEVRWFAGAWSEVAADDEGQVLVSRLGEIIISIAVAGPPGSVRQNEALAFATIVVDRLAGMPSPTVATATPTPVAEPTLEPTGAGTPTVEVAPATPAPTPVGPGARIS